ncbi:MAG TPA: hypothetical protein VI454_00605 [Verrucomicrobiae bacterium]|jgi:hypothetical protein
MTYRKRISPRAIYREAQRTLVSASPSLAARFPHLKSLTVDLTYQGTEEGRNDRTMRCTFNLEQARSLFRFDCDNVECVGGDFDLSEQLANAIAARRTDVTGEARCEGWYSKAQIEQRRCHHRLRYQFKLKY